VSRNTAIVLDKKRYFRSMVAVEGLSAGVPSQKTDRGLIEPVSQPSRTQVANKAWFEYLMLFDAKPPIKAT
jgi:hypothetical protein